MKHLATLANNSKISQLALLLLCAASSAVTAQQYISQDGYSELILDDDDAGYDEGLDAVDGERGEFQFEEALDREKRNMPMSQVKSCSEPSFFCIYC